MNISAAELIIYQFATLNSSTLPTLKSHTLSSLVLALTVKSVSRDKADLKVHVKACQNP
jgi:hypothetical protein